MSSKNGVIVILVLISLLLGGYVVYMNMYPPSLLEVTPVPVTATTTTTATSVTVEQQGVAVLTAFKNQDGAALSKLVHPIKGVRFSPYGYISTSSDVVIMAGGLSDAYSVGKLETWGVYDGSGAPMNLTFKEYSKRFIYDKDFLTAPQKATNKILGNGNSTVNIKAAYPGDTFVEYYFPGFDPQYEGMDWKSVRLVFEKMGDTWYLVGVSHDEWTI